MMVKMSLERMRYIIMRGRQREMGFRTRRASSSKLHSRLLASRLITPGTSGRVSRDYIAIPDLTASEECMYAWSRA